MSQALPTILTVESTQQITPNMQRIRLSSDGVAAFPDESEGGYVKLLFTPTGDTNLYDLAEGERPVMRTYTIRRLYRELNQIDIDFVRHETDHQDCGFAARWAKNAQVGDQIAVGGPGILKEFNTHADWFFLCADMTALPAVSAQLRKLSQDDHGYAVIQINHIDDIQPLDVPKGVEVIWTTESLSEQVKNLPWREGNVSVWCACEFDDMRSLRTYFRNEKEVAKENIYLSSYWKNGVTEEGHKVMKRQDAELNNRS